MRLPQPGRYSEYGVPASVARRADQLLRERNTCTDERVAEIDRALIELLGRWIRKPNAHAVALGRKGGKAKSPAKAAASRENGKKGGRPRKKLSGV